MQLFKIVDLTTECKNLVIFSKSVRVLPFVQTTAFGILNACCLYATMAHVVELEH